MDLQEFSRLGLSSLIEKTMENVLKTIGDVFARTGQTGRLELDIPLRQLRAGDSSIRFEVEPQNGFALVHLYIWRGDVDIASDDLKEHLKGYVAGYLGSRIPLPKGCTLHRSQARTVLGGVVWTFKFRR